MITWPSLMAWRRSSLAAWKMDLLVAEGERN